MKKIFLLAVIALFSVSACVPEFLGGGAEKAPAAEPVDIAATVDAAASTQAIETLAALATPTMEAPMPTDEPTATATETLAPTEEAAATLTENPNATPTEEGSTETPEGESANGETATPEATATITKTSTPTTVATSVYPSPTSPISINLPPESLVPRHKIEVRNTTKGPVYISLQGSTEGGYKPIIEYDIPRSATVKFEVPEGYYAVVVYVGKYPMVGYIGIYKNNQVSITIHQDSIKIEK